MISTPIKVFIGMVGLCAGCGALGLLHLENRALAHAVSARRAAVQRNEGLRRENHDLQAIVSAPAAAATDQIAQQITDARAELAQLERRGIELAAQRAQQEDRDRADLANNRDPRVGLTRLEYIQPAGRLTPSAAVQTAVAAGTKGDEAALIDATTMLSSTRAKAEELLAKLPPEVRGQWTPEKLAALWVSSVINDVTAVQITGETYQDPQHATVNFRIANHDQLEHVNLRLTRSGWKLILPEASMDQLSRRLNSATP